MNDKEQSPNTKNPYFFHMPLVNDENHGRGYMDIQKISSLTSTLAKRYRSYPRRTLILLIGMGIIASVIVCDCLGLGTPGYGFIDKLFICGGLLGCAFGFISPKIESNDMPI